MPRTFYSQELSTEPSHRPCKQKELYCCPRRWALVHQPARAIKTEKRQLSTAVLPRRGACQAAPTTSISHVELTARQKGSVMQAQAQALQPSETGFLQLLPRRVVLGLRGHSLVSTRRITDPPPSSLSRFARVRTRMPAPRRTSCGSTCWAPSATACPRGPFSPTPRSAGWCTSC